MKKNLFSMLVVVVLVVMFSTMAFADDKYLQKYRKYYREFTEVANEAMGPEALYQINQNVMELKEEGKPIEAAIQTQYMSLMFRDGAKCGNTEKRKKLASNYEGATQELLAGVSMTGDNQTIMNEAKQYYYSSKTRMKTLKDKSCRARILSSR